MNTENHVVRHIYSLPPAVSGQDVRPIAWLHEALDRNMVVHPDHAYRYDNWQDK